MSRKSGSGTKSAFSKRRYEAPQVERPLSQSEARLWGRVTQTVNPLASDKEALRNEFENYLDGGKAARDDGDTTRGVDFSSLVEARPKEQVTHSANTDRFVDGTQIDRKMLSQLRRGKLAPEASIDLHGDFVDDAKRRLVQFIQLCMKRDMRLVLVVTGKGGYWVESDEGPRQTGVIKRSLKLWVNSPELRPYVRSMTAAHHRHGGSGAFYLYLKRKHSRRKSPK